MGRTHRMSTPDQQGPTACTLDAPALEAPQCGGNALAQQQLRQAGPQSSSDSVLDTAAGCTASGAGAASGDFVEAFNDEFRSILHAFGVDEASSPGLTEEQLRELFTDGQRGKLMDFICTGVVPDRLFNGDETGGATAQQRILMSAHILAEGHYRPGSFDQEVHARMCYHWAQIVHHYAGVTVASGPMAEGVMGNFDHDGNVVLGSGRSEGGYSGRRVLAADLPDTETPGGVGPLIGRQRETAERERERRAEDPSRPARVHRRASLPFDQFESIRPGDWLWYYNGNASPGGAHSVIFSRWTSEPGVSEGVHYRDAIVFSQRSPDAGGTEHSVRLGDRAATAEGHAVRPITNITRVSQDARPARTPEELLPHSSGRATVRLNRHNEAFLRVIERRHGGTVDRGFLMQWIREQNGARIAQLGSRLSDGQRALLEETNGSDDLETLVRLSERLHQIGTNAALLEGNERRTYDEDLDQEHAGAEAELARQREEIHQELQEIDAELTPIEDRLDALREERERLDLSDDILALQRRVGGVWRQIQDLPRGQERDDLLEQRRILRARIDALRGEQRDRRGQLRDLRAQMRDLEREARPLRRRRARVEGREADAEGDLPYGRVHPGRLRGEEVRGRTTGLLRNLEPQPDWRQLLAVEAPRPVPGTRRGDPR